MATTASPRELAAPKSRTRVARLAWFPPSTGINPYQDLLYEHLARFGITLAEDASFTLRWLWRERGRTRFLHFHWRPDRYYDWPADAAGRRPPEPLRPALAWLRLAGFVARLRAARALGYRIAWTIHEVYPRSTERRRLDRSAARALARVAHVLLAHDGPTAARAATELGRRARKVAVVRHGSYAGVYPAGRPRPDVRRELGIPEDAFVFLCFGAIKPDKDTALLLEAFGGLARADVFLVVAGQARDERTAAAVREAAAAESRIRAHVELVPDEDVAELFGACDVAVFPRSSGWTSGSLILALSLGVPVIAAAAPAYVELTERERAGWLFEPGDPRSLRAALASAAADPDGVRERGEAAAALAEGLSWTECAARTADLLFASLGTRPGPEPAGERAALDLAES